MISHCNKISVTTFKKLSYSVMCFLYRAVVCGFFIWLYRTSLHQHQEAAVIDLSAAKNNLLYRPSSVLVFFFLLMSKAHFSCINCDCKHISCRVRQKAALRPFWLLSRKTSSILMHNYISGRKTTTMTMMMIIIIKFIYVALFLEMLQVLYKKK